MTYQSKYIPKTIGPSSTGRGRRPNPKSWKNGTCLITRDKYYAFAKHKAQAHFRGESYELTFEDWCSLWPDDVWIKRGRQVDDLCLTRWDFAGEWSMVNVVVCTRRDHFRIKSGKYHND
jgi:hypothetical protein